MHHHHVFAFGESFFDGHIDYSFLMVLWLEEFFEHVARHSLARTLILQDDKSCSSKKAAHSLTSVGMWLAG
jgi:hypothetical protein